MIDTADLIKTVIEVKATIVQCNLKKKVR